MDSSNARLSASAPTGLRGPDFIGIGAQRTGTSWMYACLYEHAHICMPQKEINFFSRDRNWSRGFDWYESVFANCPSNAITGEFSTSYLTDAEAPARIRGRYPHVRLIVSLRHPVERAYSSYLNDIVAGVVQAGTGFPEALESHPEYVEAGRYANHLRRYLDLFARDQLFVSIFDDARKDPLAAIQGTYRFLGVDPTFRPSMLDRRVGIGRVPRSRWIERSLIGSAAAFRRRRALRPVWWTVKRSGLGDRLRALNTRRGAAAPNGLEPEERQYLVRQFEPDVSALEKLLHVDLPSWRR